MITGADFYAWNPNYFQSRDPETGKFFGNVIGNFSLEDQLAIVDREGEKQKTDIQALGEEQALAIELLSQKFITFWRIAEDVEKAITGTDPPERSEDSGFIEAFLENYVPPVSEEIDVGTPTETEESEPVSSGAAYYSWQPNYFQAKNPETLRFFGNVIGNVPAQEQIQTVTDEGKRQKNQILETGTAEELEILEMSEKFRHIAKINKDTMKELIAFFGGVFVLDSSMLDGSPLG